MTQLKAAHAVHPSAAGRAVLAYPFGAENMSLARVLPAAARSAGVSDEVIGVVEEAAPNAYAPIVVGVGFGGDLEMAALLPTRALLRPTGSRNPDWRYAVLEDEFVELINATGIGPQCLGGKHTALDVPIEHRPTHIATIPIDVKLGCRLQRHANIRW